MRKETQCVHSGSIDDTLTGGVNSPIYTSSAFGYLDRKSVSYPRYFNTPNQNAVVEKVCALEGAEDGVLFSSGMAAMSSAILAFAGAGDHVVMMDELYGGTHAFATDQFPRFCMPCGQREYPCHRGRVADQSSFEPDRHRESCPVREAAERADHYRQHVRDAALSEPDFARH